MNMNRLIILSKQLKLHDRVYHKNRTKQSSDVVDESPKAWWNWAFGPMITPGAK